MNQRAGIWGIIDASSQPWTNTPWEWLFVYGTLKRGQRNHALLLGAPFGGEARIDGMRLYDLGPFPMAIAEAGFHIEGELFGVDARLLAELDRFERSPRLYERILCPIAPMHAANLANKPAQPSHPPQRAWLYRGRAHQVRHVPPIGPRYDPTPTHTGANQ